MNFTESDEDKLINIIAKHQAIYDAGHASYRNNLVKENVWNRIGQELNKNSEECKKKWKFIRDGYNRFKKKHKLGTGSGAPKNSKNQRHQQLLFLDGVSQHRSGGSNIPTSPQEFSDNEEETNRLHCETQVLVREAADDVLSSNNESQNGDDSVIETVNESREQTLKNQTQPKEKPRKRNTENELLKIWKERDERRHSLLESTLKKKDDDVELFGSHIAQVLRTLPPLEKAEAKKQLGIILSDYEIKAARHASTRPSSSALSHYTSFSDFIASSSSSENPTSPVENSTYALAGTSNRQQYANTSHTQGPVHYMWNAYSPTSGMTTSPESIELSIQADEESEESKRTTTI